MLVEILKIHVITDLYSQAVITSALYFRGPEFESWP
jgi:hypothetical protein